MYFLIEQHIYTHYISYIYKECLVVQVIGDA